MKIAHTANPPIVFHAGDTVNWNTAHTGTPKADVNFIASELAASSKVTQQHLVPRDVLAVPSKSSESKEAQFSQHTVVQKNVSHQQAHNWQGREQLFHEYCAYKDDFIGMFTKFKAMCDGHLRRVNVAEYRTYLLGDIVKYVQSDFYRIELKTREFRTVEIVRMRAQDEI